MSTPLDKKTSVDELRKRFDADVESFTNLGTGQKAAIDAPLVMELIARAALACTPGAKRVLDIGCGAGNYTLKLLQFKNTLDCDLLDVSTPMLEQALKRVSPATSGGIRTIQGDIRTVELPAGCYDIILAAAVLHHLRDIEDWRATFKKMYSLTAPGGGVWIADLVVHENQPVHDFMWDKYADYLDGVAGEAYRKNIFDLIDKYDSPRPVTFQIELLREVGFSYVDVLHKNTCFAAFGAVKNI